MSHIRRKKCLRRGETAFSLVEVAIAFAILSFAMITLIGLLPLALTTFRETKRDTVHADILQYVASQANLTPFTDMTPVATGVFASSLMPWTFDDQGGVIQAATTNLADTLPMVYSATITVTPSPLLPGASVVSTNTYLLTVAIVDTDQPNRPTTNTIVVANMGK
jgi:uncharacterized protein (TIGR02598 family)